VEEGGVNTADDVVLRFGGLAQLAGLYRQGRLARHESNVSRVHAWNPPDRRGHVLDRPHRQSLSPYIKAAAEGVDVVESIDERTGNDRADDEREDNQREHREGDPGAEQVPQRIGNRHPQHRREATDMPKRC
jgi:hypothetical protein